MAIPRIYLAGQIIIEDGDRVIRESELPGRQGRIAFGFVAANRHRAITRDELIDAIWPDASPAELETSFSAILSKLRAAMRKLGWARSDAGIDVLASSVVIRFPPHTWIDVEAATHAIDEAEGALRAGEASKAWGFSNVAIAIARRPFLMNYDAPWIDAKRARMNALLVRGLECMALVSESSGDLALAIQYVTETIEREPFRESAYQHLMRLHAAKGNRAEALRVFYRCRELLREELATEPSAETQRVLLELQHE